MFKIISKNNLFIIAFLFFLFTLNLSFEYKKYKNFIEEEIYVGDFEVINIYDKKEYLVLKLSNNNFVYFTSVNDNLKIEKLQSLRAFINTQNIGFLSYLKGFYAKTLFIENIRSKENLKIDIYKNINQGHQTQETKELFNALFLAIAISSKLREICTNYSISHLIAISGFHLAVLSLIIYAFSYYPYSYLQKNYFPYRNKKFDISIITILILATYFIFIGLVPSLFRSFLMLVIAIYFLRYNIKILSFTTLLLTFSIIIAIYPKFLFSISFWFSILGVFYIFLYLQYFKNLPKIFSFFFFNFWLFFAFNPIVHYFFYTTSYEQLLSPLITIVFTVFYPFELMLHLFSYPNILDNLLSIFLSYKINTYEIETPFLFLILYLIVSFLSIFYKTSFVVLNLLLILFSLYLYL